MATQDKNLIVYNGGELQKAGATDKLQIYAADFDQNVAIAGTLGVTGASTLAGVSATNGSFSGTLGVTGATTLSSTLGVTGATTLAALNAQASTLDSLAVTNAATVGGTLGVTGASTFTGDISGGNASLSGTLGVSGASTLASLGVTNNATVGGTLGVTGASTLASAAITNNATVGGTFGVTGASSLSTLSTSGAATLDSASITNNASVGGTLGVTGNTTLTGTLAAGASTLASASITNNATVGGTLGVTGAATLSSSLGVTGTSTFTGDMTAGNIDASTLDVSGAATVGSTLGVTGNTTVGGTLGVTGATTLSSTLSAGASTLSSATVTDALSAGSISTVGTLSAGASTLGNTTVGTLGASGAATLSSTLAVTGAVTLSDSLSAGASTLSSAAITNNATVGGTLGVTGNTTLSGTLSAGASTLSSASITNNATVGGTFGATGAATLSSTLAVTGVATFSDDLNVAGDLTVNGSIISRGQQDVIIKDAFLDLAFGDFSGAVTSGGFTVSMNKAVDFTAETVTTFTAKDGAILPTFTVSGSPAFVAGDIVAITGAGDSENDGLFAVESVSGSVVVIKNNLAGLSAPFLQNDFKAASTQTAKAYKVDLAAVAVADGANFPQAGGGAWPKGTFITAYFPNATVSNVVTLGVPQGFAAQGAWQSVGQVGLNEAYGTDNTINLSGGRDLVVNKPGGAGTASINYLSNKASFYRVADDTLSLGVWDAAAVNPKSKIEFVKNAADYDINLSSASSFSAAALNVSEQAKGGNGSWKVTDISGATTKGELSIAQSGAVSLTAGGGSLVLTAGDTNVVAIASDTMFKADFANKNFASLGYKVGVAGGLAAKKIVAASGVVAAPSSAAAANVLGVSLAAEASGTANCCTIHGSLVQILPAPGATFSVGDVAYLAANGEISNTAPTASGSYVMRVGYIVNLPASSEPVVQFAPQFIAKIL